MNRGYIRQQNKGYKKIQVIEVMIELLEKGYKVKIERKNIVRKNSQGKNK